ncbi:helix-turn-helix domain-containing protein [Lachnospiraceae bacterium 62-35]
MLNLLIADDDSAILEGLSQFVSSHFPDIFTIFQAENGAMALEIMRETPIHILLSDIKMPLLDGLQLIQLLKSAQYGCRILVLSGYDDYPLIRTALKTGACDYLLKPVNFSLLSKALEELTGEEPLPWPIQLTALCSEDFLASLSTPSLFQPDFYDIPTVNNPFITYDTLKSYLDKTQFHIINLDFAKTRETLNQFFRHAHPELISSKELRDILSQFVYNIMHHHSSMIRIISKYKLTDFDILSCVKNMPTLSQLQTHFLQIVLKYMEELENICREHENQSILQAIQYIQGHYSSELMLEDVAEQFHLHPNYFSRLFKLRTGVTFRDYLRNTRIEKARELLSDPSLKINQIALLVGYKDTAHFNRAFKDLTGTTPSHYRKTGKR